MQFPRFTTRRLMVLVAVVAVLASGGVEVRRLVRLSRFHRQMASQWEFRENVYLSLASGDERQASAMEGRLIAYRAGHVPPDIEEPQRSTLIRWSRENPIAYRRLIGEMASIEARNAARLQALARRRQAAAEHFRKLRIRRERAARYPWLVVPPDPPPPQ